MKNVIQSQTGNYTIGSYELPLAVWQMEINSMKQRFIVPDTSFGTLAKKKKEALTAKVKSCIGKYMSKKHLVQLVEKLKKRNADLESRNNELDAFSYSVSHDLKGPLRGIYSYGKILEEECINSLDAEGKKVIQLILQNSKKMEQLINDLLAFSKLGRKDTVTQDINMRALVKTVTGELLSLPFSGKEKIELTIHDILPASGDQGLVKQVWVNLVSNAFKYSGKKSKSVIEIGSCSKGDENVYYIKDNGAGFDMKYYDKLFGVFQRLHSENEFEGTGIGLATTRRIIQKHRGRIWAESKLNEGTIFYFSLPALDGKQG